MPLIVGTRSLKALLSCATTGSTAGAIELATPVSCVLTSVPSDAKALLTFGAMLASASTAPPAATPMPPSPAATPPATTPLTAPNLVMTPKLLPMPDVRLENAFPNALEIFDAFLLLESPTLSTAASPSAAPATASLTFALNLTVSVLVLEPATDQPSPNESMASLAALV